MNKILICFLAICPKLEILYRRLRSGREVLHADGHFFFRDAPRDTSYQCTSGCNKGGLPYRSRILFGSKYTAFFSILALVGWLTIVPSSGAQSTTITSTITDTGGVAWVSGKFTFTFNGPQNASWPGGAFSRTVTGTLDGTASFSQLLPSTTTIVPGGTAWNLQVCPLTGISQACFNVLGITTGGGTQPVTVTPPALSILAGQLPVAAYADAEIVAPVSLGFIYYQATTATTGTYRQCQGLTGTSCTTWGNISSGGGAGLPCVTTALSLQFNNAGAFGCLLYTYNAGTNTILAAGNAPVLSIHSIATAPVGSLGFANAIQLSTPENSGVNAIFQTTGTSPTVKMVEGSVSLAMIIGNSGTGRCDFAQSGIGTADCAIGLFGIAQDTPADAVNGQDLIAVQGLVGLNGAGSKTIRNAVAFRADSPANNLGICCPAPEHATNVYGFEVVDLGAFGTSNTEMAGLKIHSITAPSAGTKFSIKADVGSGLASFGDSVSLGGVGSGGVLNLLGATSGTATFTGPAVAGTVTNPVVSSNAISAPLFNSTADGVHAGLISLVGNTTPPALPANTFNIIGPNLAAFTAYALQPSSTAPTTGQCLVIGTVAAGIAPLNFNTCSGGSPAFSAITSGTNTTAAMVHGTGSSLAFTGTSTFDASAMTAAGAFKYQVLGGCTAAAQGVLCYDSTAGNVHTQAANADGIIAVEQTPITLNTIPKAVNNTISLLGASAITDDGQTVNSTEFVRSANTVFVTGNFTTASTSLVNITGLSWTFGATQHNYRFHCNLSYSQATAAAANAFGVQAATTAPTNLYAAMRVSTGLAITGTDATLPTLNTTTATNIGTFTPSAAGAIGNVPTIFVADIWGMLEQGAGATTLNIMALTGSASDSLTIYRGSACSLLP